jgi:plastocyanin
MTSTHNSGRRTAGISLAAAALVVAVAGNPPATRAASPAAVTIQNFAFMPRVLTISAGTTVTWTNKDGSPHTIAERNTVFRSAALDTGDTFSHTFATPGDFQYLCTIHTMMKGEIIVTPAKN